MKQWSIMCPKYRVGSVLMNEWTGLKHTVIRIEEDGTVVTRYEENENFPALSGTTEYLHHLTYERLIQY